MLKRPVIGLTIMYALLIVLANQMGIFGKIPKNDIALSATGNSAKIIGRIISEPEESGDKTSFVIEAYALNGEKSSGRVMAKLHSTSEMLEYGDIVEARGMFYRPFPPSNPGTFSYKEHLYRKRIYSILSVYYPDNIKVIGYKKSPFLSAAFKLRNKMLAVFNKSLPEEHAAVISGITIGDKSGLNTHIRKTFTDSGLMHVLVASGSNVAFVAIIFFWVFRSILRINRKLAFILLLPVIFFYTMLTGAEPPVVRAAIMASAIIASTVLVKNSDLYNSVFIAAIIILIHNPQALFEAGFQMSFAATLGLIYFLPIFQNYSKNHLRVIRWFSGYFFTALAAQIAVAPLAAYYFNKIPLVGVVSNLFILPLIGVSLAAGFIMFFCGIIWQPLLWISAFVTKIIISAIICMADFFASARYSTLTVPSPSLFTIALFYLFVIGLPRIKHSLWKIPVISAAFLILFLTFIKTEKNNENELSITFLDVGLGNAIYCEFPMSGNMLIDGSGDWDIPQQYDTGESIVLKHILYRKKISIDKVILTTPRINHYRGLIAIMNRLKTKEFFSGTLNPTTLEWDELSAVIYKRKIKHTTIDKNTCFEKNGVKISLIPCENGTISVKLNYKDFSALICGDSCTELSEGNIIVLLIPFHGRKPLPEGFLLKNKPKYAIISSDKPSGVVLQQLKGIERYVTRASGAVTVTTDGKTWLIKETLNNMPMEIAVIE